MLRAIKLRRRAGPRESELPAAKCDFSCARATMLDFALRAHGWRGYALLARMCTSVRARARARAYWCHNFASCLCLHHTCYGEHSCSCRLCMLPASQPAEIAFQWSQCFQWFLTARASERAHTSSAFQSFANYRAELRKRTVHRALERDSASYNATDPTAPIRLPGVMCMENFHDFHVKR